MFLIMFAGNAAANSEAHFPDIVLTQEPGTETNPVGTEHTVTAEVITGLGSPWEDFNVTFEVISGPHVGQNGTNMTNVNGIATWTYEGSIEGVDGIQAHFTDEYLNTWESNVVAKNWIPEQTEIPEFPTIALPIIAVIGLAFFFQRRRN